MISFYPYLLASCRSSRGPDPAAAALCEVTSLGTELEEVTSQAASPKRSSRGGIQPCTWMQGAREGERLMSLVLGLHGGPSSSSDRRHGRS